MTFEELQSLFMEMFEGDSGAATVTPPPDGTAGRKRGGADMSSAKAKAAAVAYDAAIGFLPSGNSRHRVSRLILATWIYLIGSSPNYAARVSDNSE